MALKAAVEVGNINLIKSLIPNADQDEIDTVFYSAAIGGKLDIVKLLLPNISGDKVRKATILAATYGQREVVEWLDTKITTVQSGQEAEDTIKQLQFLTGTSGY